MIPKFRYYLVKGVQAVFHAVPKNVHVIMRYTRIHVYMFIQICITTFILVHSDMIDLFLSCFILYDVNFLCFLIYALAKFCDVFVNVIMQDGS